ncbi:hypothetical protein E4659_09250 [Dickeya dianthicola]|uniref:hypothetical protein n=1 Tax=Dickeya dianthicola TaxID=204039 RepID=UPI0016049ED4|nr:hypothetical protein [Dickeya dianthicola]MCI4121526.1 hypothetical protein [Dickeya dianthicola]MCI4125839.1 hypothetical protein [Dickeya dianthicola]UOO21520.1 hypothetical protein E4659_09250 [Dickeya dianthicola]
MKPPTCKFPGREKGLVIMTQFILFLFFLFFKKENKKSTRNEIALVLQAGYRLPWQQYYSTWVMHSLVL